MLIRIALLLSVTAITRSPACAQRTSFGIVGGTNLTRDFPTSRTTYLDPQYPNGLTNFDLFSEGHRMTIGLSAEISFGKGLSLEGNAIRRPLQLERRLIFPSGSTQHEGLKQIITWQFPVLLKYRLPTVGRLQPFLAAGPSFRTRDNPAPSEPSQIGGTLGAGIEFRKSRWRVAPALRYTRWQYDGNYPRIATKRDQFEVVVGLNYATSVPSWTIGDRKLRFGLAVGMPFTKGIASLRQGTDRIDELLGYLAGLVAEVEINKRWSVEANALYRPFRGDTVGIGQLPGGPSREYRDELTVLTWEFPVLAKYRVLPNSRVRPVIEAGPSFRLSGNLNGTDPSPVGFTSGAGVETDYGVLRISPLLRFTIWAHDRNVRGPLTARNQVEFLLGFTF